MLQEFTVDNFKSLINVTFRPHEQNLLLGVNNAGKTNLCQAINFLAGTAQLPLEKCAYTAARGPYGITNNYFAKPTVEFKVKASVPFESEELTFNYSLTISVQTSLSQAPTLEVEREILRVTGTGFDDICLLENTRNGVRLLHESNFRRGSQDYALTSAPRETTMLFRLYDLQTNPRANCFKNYVSLWQYYALSPEAMRSFQHHPNQMVLSTDGGNLASVIYHLKTANERRYRRLLEKIQAIDPRIDLINFMPAGEGTIVMLFEDSKGNRLPAGSASSGTLRFLALLYVLSAQPFLSMIPLIIVEEPENGLYAGHLKELLQAVEELGPRPQLIFTSHSPYFIDLFDDRLDGVFVLQRGDQHSSLTQPDVEQVRKRLETFPLGEQHFREMLA